jgi:arylsulfatase A-like enzyme
VNLVYITLDSLNRHLLPCYGNDWVQTPSLDRLAARGVVFDHHYTGSLPCMPARREMWTGTEEMWWRWWGPLEPWDRPLAYELGRHGVVSQLMTDHYHFFEWGAHSYEYDFDGYTSVRGHEHDNLRTRPYGEAPEWARVMLQRRVVDGPIYVRNVQDFWGEEDFFAPRTLDQAARWLRQERPGQPWYLHVDAFDPHEPFHVPEPYRSLYTDDDWRLYSPWPLYGRVHEGSSAISERELAWVRAQYAGKVTMADRWLGRVLDALDEGRLRDDTIVVLTTDHGHYLGDHGWIGKPQCPVYDTLSHIPLLIWWPGCPGGARCAATTQTIDLYPTLLEMMGCPTPDTTQMHGRSFAGVLQALALRGESDTHRNYSLSGYYGGRVALRSEGWTLLRAQDPQRGPLYAYTHDLQVLGRSWAWRRRDPGAMVAPDLQAGRYIPGLDMPVWRVPESRDWGVHRDMLFAPDDPEQERNVVGEHPEQVVRLEEILREHLVQRQAPGELFARLHLTR